MDAVSHLIIVTGTTLTATSAVDTQAAVTALRVLAAAGIHDTGPYGSERLMVVDTPTLNSIRAMRARGVR